MLADELNFLTSQYFNVSFCFTIYNIANYCYTKSVSLSQFRNMISAKIKKYIHNDTSNKNRLFTNIQKKTVIVSPYLIGFGRKREN